MPDETHASLREHRLPAVARLPSAGKEHRYEHVKQNQQRHIKQHMPRGGGDMLLGAIC